MKDIAGLPTGSTPYTRFDLIEFERRVATAPGVYTATFYRYCNAPSNLVWTLPVGLETPAAGTVFTSRSFARGAIVQSGKISGAISVTFDDHDDLFKALALLYDFLDWRVKVWSAGVAGDGNFTLTWATLHVIGRVEDIEWKVEGGNTFELEIGFDGANRVSTGPREKYSSTCRFRFKDARCGYVGSETDCDRTYTRCVALGNQVRFGGFRKIPSPDDNPPVWGGSGASAGEIAPSRQATYPEPEPAPARRRSVGR